MIETTTVLSRTKPSPKTMPGHLHHVLGPFLGGDNAHERLVALLVMADRMMWIWRFGTAFSIASQEMEEC